MALEANPEELVPAINNMRGLVGNHEGYLRSILGLSDELWAFVSTPQAGVKLNGAMTNAHQKGTALVRSMHEIIDALNDGVTKLDAADIEAAGGLTKADDFGGSAGLASGFNGVNDVAGSGYQAGGGMAAPKVNLGGL